jgi:transposase
MKKYQTKFKLKVIENFMVGSAKAKLLARPWSVPKEKIRS